MGEKDPQTRTSQNPETAHGYEQHPKPASKPSTVQKIGQTAVKGAQKK